MPKLQPADESFFTTAPSIFKDRFEINRPASEVWAELVNDRPLDWCKELSITWTSARPFAVGTTRTAKVFGGVLTAHERFFLWEDGRRKAFYIEKANAPVFKRLAEDYLVEATSTDSCAFTWTIALEPTALGKPGGPLNKVLFKRLFAQTRKHFAAR